MMIDSGLVEALRYCYQYSEDIADDDLLDEAIAILEQMLPQEVLAYLALLQKIDLLPKRDRVQHRLTLRAKEGGANGHER